VSRRSKTFHFPIMFFPDLRRRGPVPFYVSRTPGSTPPSSQPGIQFSRGGIPCNPLSFLSSDFFLCFRAVELRAPNRLPLPRLGLREPFPTFSHFGRGKTVFLRFSAQISFESIISSIKDCPVPFSTPKPSPPLYENFPFSPPPPPTFTRGRPQTGLSSRAALSYQNRRRGIFQTKPNPFSIDPPLPKGFLSSEIPHFPKGDSPSSMSFVQPHRCRTPDIFPMPLSSPMYAKPPRPQFPVALLVKIADFYF